MLLSLHYLCAAHRSLLLREIIAIELSEDWNRFCTGNEQSMDPASNPPHPTYHPLLANLNAAFENLNKHGINDTMGDVGHHQQQFSVARTEYSYAVHAVVQDSHLPHRGLTG